jgi:hypothetical protein
MRMLNSMVHTQISDRMVCLELRRDCVSSRGFCDFHQFFHGHQITSNATTKAKWNKIPHNALYIISNVNSAHHDHRISTNLFVSSIASPVTTVQPALRVLVMSHVITLAQMSVQPRSNGINRITPNPIFPF